MARDRLPGNVPGVRFSLAPRSVPPVETRYRRIVTQIPAPESLALLERLSACEPRSMWGDVPPLAWSHAEGAQIWDAHGNCFLDFASNAFQVNGGHSQPEVLDAMRRQLDGKQVNTYLYATEVRARLVETLTSLRSNFDTVLLLSTGSEAIECALKLARSRGRERDPRKVAMIAFEQGFHGKTLGAQQLSGTPRLKGWIGNLDPDIHHIPFPFPGVSTEESRGERGFELAVDRLIAEKRLDPDRVAGIVYEPYQGWSSNLAPPAYVLGMRRWADRHDALLIADEIQSGLGRSGRLFGSDHFEEKPDIICLSKAISNGVPLSAVLSRREILDCDPETSWLNSTHSGNTLMCSAALASVEFILRERLWERAASLGEILGARAKELQRRFSSFISGVRGVGLSWTIFTQNPDLGLPSKELPLRLVEKALGKGLLLFCAPGPFLKLTPPLVIEEDALLEGLSVLEECFEEVTGGDP
jgi:4-aminobutyrate aminotransferase / (S)-3-amino-2-methylpropionate transaminase / 5-aminovalerate transaminase